MKIPTPIRNMFNDKFSSFEIYRSMDEEPKTCCECAQGDVYKTLPHLCTYSYQPIWKYYWWEKVIWEYLLPSSNVHWLIIYDTNTLKFLMWAIPYWLLWEWACSDSHNSYRFTKNLSLPLIGNPIVWFVGFWFVFFFTSSPAIKDSTSSTWWYQHFPWSFLSNLYP